MGEARFWCRTSTPRAESGPTPQDLVLLGARANLVRAANYGFPVVYEAYRGPRLDTTTKSNDRLKISRREQLASPEHVPHNLNNARVHLLEVRSPARRRQRMTERLDDGEEAIAPPTASARARAPEIALATPQHPHRPLAPRAVEVTGLVRDFGSSRNPIRAVDNLDLSVHTGEIYGFLRDPGLSVPLLPD